VLLLRNPSYNYVKSPGGRGQGFTPLREDYNYKSLAAVAHTPGWNVTPVAGCGGSLLHTGALDVNALVGYVCMEVHKSVVDDRGVDALAATSLGGMAINEV